jgi:hypothetical protein
MKKVYTTANGKQVNLDALISDNEQSIAVGNMKVNARGDKLGPGGKIEQTKEQIMKEYYKLNTPVAVDTPPQPHQLKKTKDLVDDWVEPTSDLDPEHAQTVTESKPGLRGKLADSVSQSKVVEKTEVKKTGPSRI